MALAFLICAGAWAADAPGVSQATAPGAAESLSAIEQIRSLPAQEAILARPVKLRAVVTYWDPDHDKCFIAQDDAGIQVQAPPGGPRLASGQWIELTAQITRGKSALMLAAPRITVLGAGALPAARRMSFASLRYPDPVELGWTQLARKSSAGRCQERRFP
jgi:hypothetical protein